MFRRAGRELHQVEAGWSLGGTLAPASSQPHPFLFGHFSIFCFGNGTDLCVQSLFISFASMETVKSSLKAKRKMGQGIFDVS